MPKEVKRGDPLGRSILPCFCWVPQSCKEIHERKGGDAILARKVKSEEVRGGTRTADLAAAELRGGGLVAVPAQLSMIRSRF